MKLSPETNAIFNSTCLNKIESKIIGEFAGTDVHLLPGEEFHEVIRYGCTYVTRSDSRSYLVATNYIEHIYTIHRRTPKSYVVSYKTSIIYAYCSAHNEVFKIVTQMPDLLGFKSKRIFPFCGTWCQDHITSLYNILQQATIHKVTPENTYLSHPCAWPKLVHIRV